MNTKVCRTCNQELPLDKFYFRKGKMGKSYPHSHCGRCFSQRVYPSRTKLISNEGYAELMEEQGGVCAICGDVGEKALAVDHCHSSGKVRGLLCVRCNVGLGMFRDRPDLLVEAISYLKQSD